MFGSMQTMIIFPVKVFIDRYYAMMGNTLAQKCRKLPKNHPKVVTSGRHFLRFS